MLVQGKTDRGIAGVFTRAGVPTPSGGVAWNPRTIVGIATDQIYCGRVVGLRWEGVEPKTRRKQTYGKSEAKLRRDQEQAKQRILDADSIRSLYSVLKQRLDRAGEDDKRFVLKSLGGRVVVALGGITLELVIPGKSCMKR